VVSSHHNEWIERKRKRERREKKAFTNALKCLTLAYLLAHMSLLARETIKGRRKKQSLSLPWYVNGERAKKKRALSLDRKKKVYRCHHSMPCPGKPPTLFSTHQLAAVSLRSYLHITSSFCRYYFFTCCTPCMSTVSEDTCRIIIKPKPFFYFLPRRSLIRHA
jgi:hypothetical protein